MITPDSGAVADGLATALCATRHINEAAHALTDLGVAEAHGPRAAAILAALAGAGLVLVGRYELDALRLRVQLAVDAGHHSEGLWP